MTSTADIIREATSLPIEERALVVDSLLRSLTTVQPEIDREWAAVAKRRLEELRSGQVKPISGETVFEKNPATPGSTTCSLHPKASVSIGGVCRGHGLLNRKRNVK
jgi:putative addiction module component (TIGR02574 family)